MVRIALTHIRILKLFIYYIIKRTGLMYIDLLQRNQFHTTYEIPAFIDSLVLVDRHIIYTIQYIY